MKMNKKRIAFIILREIQRQGTTRGNVLAILEKQGIYLNRLELIRVFRFINDEGIGKVHEGSVTSPSVEVNDRSNEFIDLNSNPTLDHQVRLIYQFLLSKPGWKASFLTALKYCGLELEEPEMFGLVSHLKSHPDEVMCFIGKHWQGHLILKPSGKDLVLMG